MNLDLVHIDAVGTNLHQHLVSVTGGVVAVGGREVKGVGPVLLEKRGLCEVGSVTTGGQDDWAVNCDLLAVELVDDTDSTVAVRDASRLATECSARRDSSEPS